MRSSFSMFLLYHAYIYLELLILTCTIYILAPKREFFRCRVKTSKKKFRSKIKAMKEWIKAHRAMPLELIFKTVNAKLRGHYQYYGVTDNTREVKNFLVQTKWLLYKWLNRRSQKRSYTSDTFFNGLLRTFPLLEPSIKVSLFYR